MCKLGVISQERLKIEVLLLLSAKVSHICRVDWHKRIIVSDLELPHKMK